MCHYTESDIEKVVAITRRPVEYKSDKIVNEVVNFDELEKHSDIFRGDILFSCLGTTAKQAGSIANQRKVDFEYQYQAAKTASENGIGHYVLVSSSGADASSRSPYLKMKGELEDEVSSLAFQRISILQPSLLIGERESFRLGETLGSWILPLLCKLPFLKKYRPISGDEVAKKMVSVSSSAGNSNETYRLDELFLS
ncbi:hypothetical protein [Leucothrix arctica]|uniref:hypothetical protein n=1 Tax=Leucothrix arctica TaxID=1481894 RepID=UPI001BA98996|nr:hypothetical protein [Leucothrix arctica]